MPKYPLDCGLEKDMFLLPCHYMVHYKRYIVFRMTKPTIKNI